MCHAHTCESPFSHFDVCCVAGCFAVVVEQEIHKLRFQTPIFQCNPKVSGNFQAKKELMLSMTLERANVHPFEGERPHGEPVCAPIPFQSCRGSPRCIPPKLPRGRLSRNSPSLRVHSSHQRFPPWRLNSLRILESLFASSVGHSLVSLIRKSLEATFSTYLLSSTLLGCCGRQGVLSLPPCNKLQTRPSCTCKLSSKFGGREGLIPLHEVICLHQLALHWSWALLLLLLLHHHLVDAKVQQGK